MWMRENMEESKRREAAEDEKVKELVGESEQSIALANSMMPQGAYTSEALLDAAVVLTAWSVLSNSVQDGRKLTTRSLSTLMRRPLPSLWIESCMRLQENMAVARIWD